MAFGSVHVKLLTEMHVCGYLLWVLVSTIPTAGAPAGLGRPFV